MRWSATEQHSMTVFTFIHAYLRAVACPGGCEVLYLVVCGRGQGPSSPKLTPAPMTAPVGRPQQALGLLFRRATPDAFQLPALFPSSQFLETTDPQLSCHEATVGLENKATRPSLGDRLTVGC